MLHGIGYACPSSFNISWHEKPKKNIRSWLTPRVLLKNAVDISGFEN
jgi:hypothetical protein